MQITINFDDSLKTRIVDNFCKSTGYNPKIVVNGNLVDNPQSKDDFMVEKIKKFVQESAKAGEVNEAVESTRISTISKADKEIIIT